MGNNSVKAASESKSPILESLKPNIMRASPDSGGGDTNTAKTDTTNAAATTDINSLPETSLPEFPGTFAELHKKCKDVFPIVFDGAKVTMNKPLSSNFQVSHNFVLAATQPSSYKYGATYVGSKLLSKSEPFPIMLGEMDVKGSLSAQVMHAFTNNTRSRFTAQSEGASFKAVEMSTDYRGSATTASCTIANPDFIAGTGIVVGQYLQKITSKIAIGTEAMVHRGPQSNGRISSQVINSLVGRYMDDKWEGCVQVSPMQLGLHASYWHKWSSCCQLGLEFQGKPDGCLTTAGFSYDVKNADTVVKSAIDTNLTLTTTIEMRILPLPMTVHLSLQGNAKKSQYLAGIGLTMG